MLDSERRCDFRSPVSFLAARSISCLKDVSTDCYWSRTTGCDHLTRALCISRISDKWPLGEPKTGLLRPARNGKLRKGQQNVFAGLAR